MRLALIAVVACLAGAGVAAVVLGTGDDDAQPATRATTPPADRPDITSRLEPGEVGVIVTDDSLRLTTPTGRLRDGFLTLAIDNRATRRLEVVLARDRRRLRLTAGSSLQASSSALSEIQVGEGRYVVLVREPPEDDFAPITGFAQASLRVR